MSWPDCENLDDGPNLGDLLILMLASTLHGFRDRLVDDGYRNAADLIADLIEVVDDYLISTK